MVVPVGYIRNKVVEFHVVYDNIYSMKNLYKFIHDLLVDNGWRDYYGSNEKYMESYYFDRTNQAGTEMWAWWRLKKNAINPFMKYVMHIDFHTMAMNKVEIVVDGQKIKADKGEVEVVITAFIDFDTDEVLRKSIMAKLFWNILYTKTYKKKLDQESDLLEDQANILHGEIKKFFDLRGLVPSQPTFYPTKGL